jgi:histidyl-tRNA synthetase
VGLAFGVEKLLAVSRLAGEQPDPPLVVVVPSSMRLMESTFRFADSIRSAGIRVVCGVPRCEQLPSVSWQISHGKALGASYCLVVGGETEGSERILIHDLKTDEQHHPAHEQVLEWLKKRLAGQ